jgi:hypothetical protein
MKLEIQKYLASHPPETLADAYGISAKRHPQFPNLVMFKYDQIASPMSERIVQECRGIILDEAEDWSIVSRPYDKFFNLGEGHASPIDWSTARVYEKLDGSLMTLYHYAGQWRVASSGMPDAGGPVASGESMTFADLFWRTWKEDGYQLPHGFEEFCFMFELCSPHNRIIVPHAHPTLTLHGVRNLATSKEIEPENAAENRGWRCVRSFPLACADDCLAAAAELRPLECEGYVVRDANFNRVKIKSPRYVALAHLKDGFTDRRIIELVRANEGSEFLSYFPEFAPRYNEVRDRYQRMITGIHAAYESIRDIPAQKDFAAEALKTPWSAVLFSMRSGRAATPEAFLKDATIYAVERMLGFAPVEV